MAAAEWQAGLTLIARGGFPESPFLLWPFPHYMLEKLQESHWGGTVVKDTAEDVVSCSSLCKDFEALIVAEVKKHLAFGLVEAGEGLHDLTRVGKLPWQLASLPKSLVSAAL